MQEWEYLFVQPLSSLSSVTRLAFNDEVVDRSANLEEWQIANELGAQGWELVGIRDGLYNLIFKRPRTKQPEEIQTPRLSN